MRFYDLTSWSYVNLDDPLQLHTAQDAFQPIPGLCIIMLYFSDFCESTFQCVRLMLLDNGTNL